MKRKTSISVEQEVFDIMEKDAKRFGLNISSYISQLVMQKNIELNAMRLIGNLTDEQIGEEVRKAFNSQIRI